MDRWVQDKLIHVQMDDGQREERGSMDGWMVNGWVYR